MLPASLKRNDRKANLLVWLFSAVVFMAVVLLSNYKINIEPRFNVHIFAMLNAVLNSIIAVLLLAAFITVRRKQYATHKKLMLAALVLSIIFLISYIAHHLLAGEAKFGDINYDGILSASELNAVQNLRIIYLFILFSHIFLATIILPFILLTAYRGLVADYPAHKKLARYTLPLWLYVAVTGPIIYLMISPYYS